MWSGDVENGNMSRNITLYFLRHGRSSGDDEGVHEGRYDSALTKTGRMQAQTRALNGKEKGTKFDLIISSTLQRAHETARIIAEILLTPLETDADGMEMDNRPLAGLPFDVAPAAIHDQPFVISMSLFMAKVKAMGRFIAVPS
jgi:2,3-bisphosphoglycerate-dependent phosphoglycerate mutase